MLQIDRLRAAAEGIVAAAILADGWNRALTDLARAADARHAVLMRNTPHHAVSSISNEEASEAIADYMAGRAPPNSRYAHVHTERVGGFRVDHDDYTNDQLARDPYYQEFLRANGVFWHANALLAPGRVEFVELSLKRGIERGPYQPADVVVLEQILAELHAAARIAKSTLDAEARGMTWVLRKRGELIIEIDNQGRVLPGQKFAGAPSLPLRIAGNRLAAKDQLAQPWIDRAIARATARPGRMALAQLASPDGRAYLLQVHPVPGMARDVFLSAQAIAVLIERDSRPSAIRPDTSAIRDAFELTGREADVAVLLSEGLDIPTIAKRLQIQPETARTYLRDVFEKTGTSRQAELVALLARIGQ